MFETVVFVILALALLNNPPPAAGVSPLAKSPAKLFASSELKTVVDPSL